MDGNEEISVVAVREGGPPVEREKPIIGSRHEDMNPGRLQPLLQPEGHIEHNLFLAKAAHPDRAGIVPAVAGVDDDGADRVPAGRARPRGRRPGADPSRHRRRRDPELPALLHDGRAERLRRPIDHGHRQSRRAPHDSGPRHNLRHLRFRFPLTGQPVLAADGVQGDVGFAINARGQRREVGAARHRGGRHRRAAGEREDPRGHHPDDGVRSSHSSSDQRFQGC